MLSRELETYTFERFLEDYNRKYEHGTVEFEHRAAIFHNSLLQIQHLLERNRREGRSWQPGIHKFMDWTESERASLHGYKPSRRKNQPLTVLQTRFLGRSATMSNMTWNDIETYGESFGEESSSIRDQGSCGSCWAISAVEAIEAQLAKNGNPDVKVSAQALVDCVPNPQHCGGSGGCDGATGELAYDFVREHGIPMEDGLPYDATTADCPVKPLEGDWPASSRVRVDGFRALPSNQQAPLMQSLVQDGPTVVSVDGKKWMDYNAGVFDSCERDAVLGHAVLARGYGEDSGRKYWLIQNSWGSDWGERGHIRLLRHDTDEEYCGTDRKPQEGNGCDGGPSEVKVCGMCGVLYDPIIPQGVRLETADQAGSSSPKRSKGLSAVEQMDDIIRTLRP